MKNQSTKGIIGLLKNSLYNEDLIQDNISLLSGRSGLMLTSILCGDILEDKELIEFGYQQITKVTDLLSSQNNPCNFFAGIAGCGWAIDFLSKNNLIKYSTDNFLDQLDELVEQDTLKKIQSGTASNDFFHGSLGAGTYLLNRDKCFDNSVTELVSFLLSTCLHYNEDKIYWTLPGQNNEPEIDFGVAHGISAIINFLIFFQSRNPQYRSKEIKETILKTLNFIEHFKSDSTLSMFPRYLNSKFEGTCDSRVGWCRGDLNLAYSFLLYGINYNSIHHKNLALKIFDKTSKRREQHETILLDRCFCHGSAGILYMFNQLSTQLNIHSYSEVTSYWYNETIKASSERLHIDDFRFFYGGDMRLDSSILFGTSGVLLSILDYLGMNKKYNLQNMFLLGA